MKAIYGYDIATGATVIDGRESYTVVDYIANHEGDGDVVVLDDGNLLPVGWLNRLNSMTYMLAIPRTRTAASNPCPSCGSERVNGCCQNVWCM